MEEKIDPSEIYTKVPELSETSKIESVKKDEFRRGIILDSIEEVITALHVYNGGAVPEAGATQNNLYEAIGQDVGPMGVGLALLAGANNENRIMKELIEDVTSALEDNRRFRRHYDYGGMGTNFFKTCVEAEPKEDKYVLEIHAAYVGDKPEINLAEKLGKKRALYESKAVCQLAVIDDWWFNVNLEEVLQPLVGAKLISNKQINALVDYYTDRTYEVKGVGPIAFKHNKQKFELDISLDANRFLRPKNDGKDPYYINRRGDNIVGGAWTIYGERDVIDPAPKPAAICLSVSFPRDPKYRFVVPAISDEDMQILEAARDYIGELIDPSITFAAI